MREPHARLRDRSLDRLAALADGVFAFALTLIIFEIGVPSSAKITSEAELWSALGGLLPHFLMFFLSVLTLGILWNAQQVQLASVEHADREYTWLSLAYLAAAATMPFSTELLGEFITLRLALAVYWLNLFVFGMTMLLSWRYLRRAGLLHKDANGIAASTTRRILTAQALYALGVLLGLLSTYAGIALIVLVQVYFAIVVDSQLLRRLRQAASNIS